MKELKISELISWRAYSSARRTLSWTSWNPPYYQWLEQVSHQDRSDYRWPTVHDIDKKVNRMTNQTWSLFFSMYALINFLISFQVWYFWGVPKTSIKVAESFWGLKRLEFLALHPKQLIYGLLFKNFCFILVVVFFLAKRFGTSSSCPASPSIPSSPASAWTSVSY